MPSVAVDYGHIHKVVEAAPLVALPPGSDLKWYNIARSGAVIPAGVQQEAREFLRGEVAAGRLALGDELGFVILHWAGEAFLLIVCTWRNDNELWETCWANLGDGFQPIPRDEPHKPTYCVWEMGAVLHEQQAWSRYLFSARDDQAKRAYLADQASGVQV
jgi:hypothetical protein